jgi:hypothetical protein
MKLFSKFITEVFEHEFTGMDEYHDDNFHEPSELATHNIHKHSLKLQDHYGDHKGWPAIGKYTADSGLLNRHLLYKHDPKLVPDVQDFVYDRQSPEHLDKFHAHMHDVMSRFSTPHDLHVYTGTEWSPARHHDGTSSVIKVHLPAYTSTSINPDIPKIFSWRDRHLQHPNPHYKNASNIIKIHVPADSHSFYVHQPENELILPANSRLHVHHKPEFVDHEGEGKTFAIWQAKLVHDGFKPTKHMPEGET